jgi:hypothetical protein
MTNTPLPALLPILTEVALEQGSELPGELRFEDVLVKVAHEFDWAGSFRSHVWFAKMCGLPHHGSLEELIRAESGVYLHDLSLWLGRDIFGTFAGGLDNEDIAYLGDLYVKPREKGAQVVRCRHCGWKATGEDPFQELTDHVSIHHTPVWDELVDNLYENTPANEANVEAVMERVLEE